MVKITAEYERAIALAADLHVGSRFALCPEKWITSSGGRLDKLMAKGQQQLLTYWRDYVEKMRRDFHVDTVFLVGDIIAGKNEREYGCGLITADLTEQVEGAIKILEPLCKGLNVHVWSGTPYHESADYKVHKVIADAFDGVFHGYLALLRIKPSEKIAFITHEAPVAPVYPETATARDLLHKFKAEGLGKIPKINIIVRAHRHVSDYKHKRDIHVVNLPCWCCFAPYPKLTRYYFLMQPDIGGALLLIEKKTHRVRVIMFDDYPLPHIADQIIQV